MGTMPMRFVLFAALGSAALLAGCGVKEANEAANASSQATANVSAPAATGTTAAAAPASFSCGAPLEADEKLICGDAQLARLDREMFRLYQLAIKDPQSTPTDDALAMVQDGWITARGQCGADADPKSCVVEDYAERIHQLRQGSKAARDATGGVSEGPVAYRCKGLDALVTATFVNTDPNLVFIEWLDRSQALTQAASGSGAKYTGKGDDGDYSLWTKGKEALFQKPGGPEVTCKEEVIG